MQCKTKPMPKGAKPIVKGKKMPGMYKMGGKVKKPCQ